MAGKYTPLEHYLRGIPDPVMEITLSLKQIERILKVSLPWSAYESEKWWEHETEGNHVTPRAWSQAGWKIDGLDLKKKWVKFVRVEQRFHSKMVRS